MKILGATGLGGLWALEWARQSVGIDEINKFKLKFLF